MHVLQASQSPASDREDGQGLAEYALILALIAIIAIVALIFLGRPGQLDPEQRRQLGLSDSSTSASTAVPHGARRSICIPAS